MPLTLEIVTPEGIAFSETVDAVALPTVMGQIGVLPQHMPILTQLTAGELHVTQGTNKRYLAVDKGFARVLGNRLSVLTEAAISMADIDLSKVEDAQKKAEQAIQDAKNEPQFDPAEIEKLEAIVRFSLAQKLVKRRDY
jgi:F-type H+-transporting ATPase subunit epsilon